MLLSRMCKPQTICTLLIHVKDRKVVSRDVLAMKSILHGPTYIELIRGIEGARKSANGGK